MLKPLILGLGLSGKAAFRLFLTKGIVPITYDDACPTPVDFSKVSRVIVSPGFRQEHPMIVAAKAHQIPVESEIDLALAELKSSYIIGITGSNGKSTVVKKIEHVLNVLNVQALALGNIEVPLSSAVLHPPTVAIIELSAQQLETTNCSVLDLAVILNIQPNHLDRYQTMENYTKAKGKIFDLVKEGGVRLGPDVSLQEIFSVVAKKWDLSMEKIESALISYQNLPHRLEYLGDFFGKKIYNDSKSTTFSATLYALGQVKGPIQLIFGGKSKGEKLETIKEELKGYFLKRVLVRVLAIGETTLEIASLLGSDLDVVVCNTLEKAVEEGLKGEGTLLFSPGFASYDQFHSFTHRGETFKQRIEWKKKMPS